MLGWGGDKIGLWGTMGGAEITDMLGAGSGCTCIVEMGLGALCGGRFEE